jgi:precorrin-2 dehydrogenase/sirohydrochlorin ferrochelatase
MGYLPIFVDLARLRCVVIGAGEVAASKVNALIAHGADVTVVSADAGGKITEAAAAGKLRHVNRSYIYGDLRGNRIAYVVTDDLEVIERAVQEAREFGILLNVADNPAVSDFISPAVVQRGDLQIAISTSGASPSLARLLRERLERQLGPQYERLVEILRRARQYVRTHEANSAARARILKSLAAALLDCIQMSSEGEIEGALLRHLGIGMDELGVREGRVCAPERFQ